MIVCMTHRAKTHEQEEPQLTARLLVAAYSQGMFPMARSRHSRIIEWYRPDPRAILPLEGFHCPDTVRAKIRQGVFEIRHDRAFRQVMLGCARPRPRKQNDNSGTWINDAIVRGYTELHQMGLAHSVEAWREGKLVGGLYGVSLGGAFCGESMFHDPELGGTDASKCCLAHLVAHLKARGYTLLDVQMHTPHMARFGAIEIPLDQYMAMLKDALERNVSWS